MRISREAAIGVGVSVVAVGAMAIDHLIGTEPDEDDGTLVDPPAFLIGTAISLVLTAVLFRFVVRPGAHGDPSRAAVTAIVCSGLSVPALALLFLGVPFPLAGAGIALGLHGLEGERRGLATAALLVGAAVITLAAAAYLFALVL